VDGVKKRLHGALVTELMKVEPMDRPVGLGTFVVDSRSTRTLWKGSFEPARKVDREVFKWVEEKKRAKGWGM
jgi:hypothetical protein